MPNRRPRSPWIDPSSASSSALDPFGVGLEADEDEQGLGGDLGALAGLVVLDDHRLEHLVAEQLADLAVQHHLDPWVALDPVGEVARHVLRQRPLADDQRRAAGALADEDRRPSRGVAAADDRDRDVLAEAGLHRVAA